MGHSRLSVGEYGAELDDVPEVGRVDEAAVVRAGWVGLGEVCGDVGAEGRWSFVALREGSMCDGRRFRG